MDAGFLSFVQRPRSVVTMAIAFVVIVWAATLYSTAGQIGHPFPGFFYSPDRIVSAFTPQDFTGWQSGLRPWDRVIQVNGQHWSEMSRLVQEAGIGTTLVYTVERGDQSLLIPVPTMEFKPDILLRFLPGWFLYALLCISAGVFVYIRNPTGRLNRYLLIYLLLWATVMGAGWDYWLAQYKWSAYMIQPWIAVTTVAGWIFFWSFPADRARKEFLARWPLIPGFVCLAALAMVLFSMLFFVASRLDQPEWWQLYTLATSWVAFLIFAGGSFLNKCFPPLQIALRKGTPPLVRQQAWALFAGISVGGVGFVLLIWMPFSVHFPPAADLQLIAPLIVALYPLSIGYAVLRYQLFDIRVVIRKGLVYSLLTALLTATFLVLSLFIGSLFQTATGQQSFVVAIPPALLVAFLFQPARSRIQTFVDRAFFRREYEVRQTLTSFSRGLSTLRGRDQVVRLVLDTVTETLGADSADLWLSEGEAYRPTRTGEIKPLPCDKGLVAWLARERRALLLLPGDRSPQAQDLRRIKAALAVPLVTGEKVSGILTLGEKRSGVSYSQDDLDMLTTLAHSAALALENARLHEERLAILREQLAQVTAAQEEERQRIARELHDGVGPALASLNIRLRTARKLIERDRDAAAGEIEELAELAQSNIQDIRRLIYDLRPAALDQLGLVPAVREYVARYQKEHDVRVTLSLPAGSGRLPAPLETTLFRIVQEALTNVAKHAQARRVEIALTFDDNRVGLCIADDGQGFDSQAPRSSTHLGLWSMRERVEQLGGQFEVASAPGQGTTVKIQIPMPAETIAWTKSTS